MFKVAITKLIKLQNSNPSQDANRIRIVIILLILDPLFP